MKADALLNSQSKLGRRNSAKNKHITLSARDRLRVYPERGQYDRRVNETETEWAKRMKKDAIEAEKRLKKFNKLTRQLAATQAHQTPRARASSSTLEERKLGTENSKPAPRERSCSFFKNFQKDIFSKTTVQKNKKANTGIRAYPEFSRGS